MSSSSPALAPSWGRIVTEQLRMVALLQRRDFLVVGGIAAGLLALALWGLTRVTPSATPGTGPDIVELFRGLALPLVPVGALWPLGVWRRDSPERRGYFWSLPVARGPHTLVRAGAGWLLLMGVCLGIMGLGVLVVSLYAARIENLELSFAAWYLPLAAPTLAYVLISVLAVLVESPLRWVVWIAVGVLGVRIVSAVTQTDAIWNPVDGALRSLAIALRGPLSDRLTALYGPWSTHYAVWLGLGLVALVAGAFRHRDAS